VTTLLARTQAKPVDRRELVQALTGWAAATRHEPGVIQLSVSEDLERPNVFLAVVTWRDDGGLERHVAGQAFSVLYGALLVLASSSEFEIAGSGSGPVDGNAFVHRVRARSAAERRTEGG